MPTTVQNLTLSNGLNVSLCSAPHLKRCAAALRVAAGSHDVSAQWPGLAHFLEHLFFLGTERFPAEQNLMAFVQRHGGQINASTRERTTDFFFELPAPVFAAGLERLCDMLAQPRMAIADQMGEREVLHAEFIAWARDDASRAELKRLAAISARHPLRGFHAGNRFSLPVPRPAFQQALRGFYQRFYQAGQMTLSLAGPQSLDELLALATKAGSAFASGTRIEQVAPPPLRDHTTEAALTDDPNRTHLAFAGEDLPDCAGQAGEFFCTWLNNAQPGGLIAKLRERGLIESLKAQVLYQFDGQVLLDIDIALTASSGSTGTSADTRAPALDCAKAHVSALFFNWLDFFKRQHGELLNEYALLEQRSLAIGNALTLARHYSQKRQGPVSSSAITALLDQLTPDNLLQPQPQSPVDNIDWRLPEPNPFLRPAAGTATQTVPQPSLTFSPALPTGNDDAVYLRWTLQSPQPLLHEMLDDSLKALVDDAQHAGVILTFTAYGDHWQLKAAGLAEPIAAVVAQAMRLLNSPDRQTLARYGQQSHGPALIPIRQLLKSFPDQVLHSPVVTQTAALPIVWASARWIGFATGLAGSSQNALLDALGAIPGTPDLNTPQAPRSITGRRWQSEPSDAAEAAVLLFCPAPSSSIEDEAIWRLFAHLLQGPFYHRLRVELQVGYAVFSALRQVGGQSGLLFGVQSPTVTAEQLVEHIETFIQTLPALVIRSDLASQVNALTAQLDLQTMDPQQAAEMLWQAHQAGHGEDYLARLQHSLATVDRQSLLRAADQLTQLTAGRLYLANRSVSGLSWQPTK